MKLKGRGILITGANRGLGRAIARSSVAEGAHVFLCARGARELNETRRELAARAVKGQVVLAKAADVSKPEAVTRLIRSAIDGLPRFDGLVNNAGVLGPIGAIEESSWKQWVKTIEVNLYGTALLCRAAIPLFRRQGCGKIVNLSGGGATTPMPRFSAYAASKAAVVRLTETLAQETKDAKIDINAVAPGPLNTRLLDEVLAAGPKQVGEAYYQRSLRQKEDGGAPMDKAAALCVFLLSPDSDGITGRLISALWDPWDRLASRRSALNSADIYTLRRIVPKDRGLNWD